MTSRVHNVTKFRPTLKVGLGGNFYVTSTDKNNLDAICVMIKKARSAVYFNEKHNCWVVRVKSKKQKVLLKTLFERIER